MPGGRLTQQERQQIAQGLGDGLAYAEIARRLERPTSTVTREVMRNGGPTGYRADLAQRATGHRAARRRPAGSAGAAAGQGPGDEAVRAYEETLTTVFMASGTPRMMARVMSALLTSESGSLTAGELVQRLQVSPASISKAVAFLESQDLVRRDRDERRRDRYSIDDDVWYQSMMASARSTAEIAVTARQGTGILGADSQAGARLENIARFLDYVSESLVRASDQARDILSAQRSATPPQPGA
ncbi:helix-turn-helix domain-containing protein [Streptomyces sp. SID5785]|uniref:helix-turn-helix domain-containing protein n=1 Tax=Streptomyces sp. SID5785 TaxID=2690309 RepID=UPI0013616527|nr:helix-turn-helix domain-containing protein [Streptomyces sp. SID5785]MZD06025.1 helix-turn-helix domain-containing protein [Streptomyces sp. SID5785]